MKQQGRLCGANMDRFEQLRALNRELDRRLDDCLARSDLSRQQFFSLRNNVQSLSPAQRRAAEREIARRLPPSTPTTTPSKPGLGQQLAGSGLRLLRA